MPTRKASKKPDRPAAELATLRHSVPRRAFMFGAVALACSPSRATLVPPNVPRIGAKNPELVVHEVGDYECSFCAEVVPTVDALIERFGRRVAFIWRHYPLDRHPNAMTAARSAVEVRAQTGDAGFWKYHRLLFQNQLALEPPDLEEYAAKIDGLDLTRFREALRTQARLADVRRDQREVEGLGLERIVTPMFYANGETALGAYPYEALASWIESHL